MAHGTVESDMNRKTRLPYSLDNLETPNRDWVNRRLRRSVTIYSCVAPVLALLKKMPLPNILLDLYVHSAKAASRTFPSLCIDAKKCVIQLEPLSL